MAIIAVDFDKTIAFKKGEDVFEVPQFVSLYLRKWRKNKHKLILWTCREGEMLEKALAVCQEHGIQFDAVNENLKPESATKFWGYNSRKVYCNYIIDDTCPVPVVQQFEMLNRILEG